MRNPKNYQNRVAIMKLQNEIAGLEKIINKQDSNKAQFTQARIEDLRLRIENLKIVDDDK